MSERESENNFKWIEHHHEGGFFSYGDDTHVIVKREDLQFLYYKRELPPNKACHEDYLKNRKRIKEEYKID